MWQRFLTALAASSALLCAAGDARAFCRTHTCGTDSSQPCELRDGCLVGGVQAYWPSACLTYAVQAAGSPKLGLSATQIDTLVSEELGRWLRASCLDGGSPVFMAQSRGPAECDQVEYNCAHDNVNVIIFQDREWLHSSANVALTSVTMNIRTGEILDADMEVNSAQYPLRLDSPPLGSAMTYDLRMVLAHELGHFLALAHSNDFRALMRDGGKDTPDLTLDDVAGICAIYPPGSGELSCPVPPSAQGAECNGVQLSCPSQEGEEAAGCSCTPARARRSFWGRAGALALFIVLITRRRLRPRVRRPTCGSRSRDPR